MKKITLETWEISSARITAYPKHFLDPMPQVYVTIKGQEKLLFEFYPDEIQFRPEEFIGLTLDQAHDLKRRKNLAYLQS